MSQNVKIFGIRHHGPGCAKSLLQALFEMNPDRILIEGPPEGDSLIPLVGDAEMDPPVAILVHGVDNPEDAAFYPFTEFSPEWNALSFAVKKGIPVSFMDLPVGLRPERGEEHGERVYLEESPLDVFAKSAGYEDGEAWWNHMVEERNNATDLFQAILEAMKTLREIFPKEHDAFEAEEEKLREAYMRKTIRQAVKDGHKNIAVICGAWHAPVLEDLSGKKADDELLKPLQKRKMAATWVPWSYAHISRASGYGAGITSPGWYEHLWKTDPENRTIKWFGKVAEHFRNEEIDCSSAHIIEAVRLADALAAMRERPQAGLEEINEAIRTVVCMGETAPMRLVEKKLMVGDRLGSIPSGAPSVPLQGDLEKTIKTLRMKQETQEKVLDLDLRQPTDLARSHLLHRLKILGVAWGIKQGKGYSSKGTFHEIWRLQWEPGMVMAIISAAKYGNSIKDAATKMSISLAQNSGSISNVAELMNQVMLADISDAVDAVVSALDSLTAVSGDISEIMRGVPFLAQTMRYGNVRNTDCNAVEKILRHMMIRVSVGLSAACSSVDESAAGEMNKLIISTNHAVGILNDDEISHEWFEAVKRISSDNYHGLVAGLATRILFDAHAVNAEECMMKMQKSLSPGNQPDSAAAWLEGFLNDTAVVLIHDQTLWNLVDSWLSSLGDEHFDKVLPLLRRAFSAFDPNERSQLAKMTISTNASGTAADTTEIDENRANLILPTIRMIVGAFQ